MTSRLTLLQPRPLETPCWTVPSDQEAKQTLLRLVCQVIDYSNKADRGCLGASEKKEAACVHPPCSLPTFRLIPWQVRRGSQGQVLCSRNHDQAHLIC